MERRSKKILIVCPKGDINAGAIISSYQLIHYLRKKGYEIRVITSWPGTYNQRLDKDKISNKSIAYNWWTPLDTPENISSQSIPAVVAIAEEIKKFSADVVITNTSHIPWGALAASFTNTPHIWVVREYPVHNFKYLEEKMDFINTYSNKIMANSSGLATYLNNQYGLNAGSFMSYVDIDDTKLGAGDKVARFVSPNTKNINKNQIDLIKAAGIVKSRNPDISFRILLMGEMDKAYWPELKAAIKDSDVEDIVDIHDRVDRPWSMVGKNDILVQTSVSESIGRTTTEAMKLGVPVIASNIPGHREAFSLGGGVLYDLYDQNDLANKMEEALKNHDKVKKNAQSTQKKVLKTMSEEACSRPMLEVIKSVLGANNSVGVNESIYPYFRQYFRQCVSEHNEQYNTILRKNKETDVLMSEIEDLRDSRAYKIGRIQADIIRKAMGKK